MRLKPGLSETPFKFPRGYGAASIPKTNNDPNAPAPASSFWWTKEQVLAKEDLGYVPGSILLGRVDQRLIGYLDNRHVMTIAGSRSGKSATLLIPNLLLWDGSALVIDPKGELAMETADRRAAMGQAVHILDPWGVTGDVGKRFPASLDPLREMRDARERALAAGELDTLIEDSELVADALIIGNTENPHFSDAARALIRALVLWMAIDPAPGRQSLADLPNLIAEIAAQLAAPSKDGTSGLLQKLAAVDLDQVGDDDYSAWSLIRAQAMITASTPDKERGSIFSTARTQLVFLDSPAMARAVADSALVLRELKRRPATVYLCLPAARMATHSRWLRLIVNLAMAALEKEPWRDDPATLSGKVPPVLFVLEEFAALGHMATLEKAIAYMGGYGVKLWTVLQDLTQLKRDYKEGWETFLGNSGVTIAFAPGDDTTQEYLSKRMGETTFQITNKTEVSSSAAASGDTGLRREFRTMRLMTADEVGRKFARKSDRKGGTSGGLALVLIVGNYPLVVDRVYHGELVA